MLHMKRSLSLNSEQRSKKKKKKFKKKRLRPGACPEGGYVVSLNMIGPQSELEGKY